MPEMKILTQIVECGPNKKGLQVTHVMQDGAVTFQCSMDARSCRALADTLLKGAQEIESVIVMPQRKPGCLACSGQIDRVETHRHLIEGKWSHRHKDNPQVLIQCDIPPNMAPGSTPA